MTPASQSFKTFRQQIGLAIYLLELLSQYTSKEWAGELAWVAQGRIIPDSELQEELGVKPQTLCAWRRRLKAAGLLQWMIKPGVGRMYAISGWANHISESSKPSEKTAHVESAHPRSLEPRKPDIEPLASRFVQ